MENPFLGMKGLARNPLGILAIFLGVLYGVAGLLLAVNDNPLDSGDQSKITWFVVVFPFVVLFAFLWLVAKHHTKLYAPTDYRSDQSFHGLVQQDSNSIASIDAQRETIAANQDGKPDSSQNKSPPNVSIDFGLEGGKWTSFTGVYVSESLVLDKIGIEYQTGFRRSVKIKLPNGDLSVSGSLLAQKKNVFVYVGTGRNIEHGIQKVQSFLTTLESRQSEIENKFPNSKFHVVLVSRRLGSLQESKDQVDALSANLGRFDAISVEVRSYEASALLIERGIISPPEENSGN